MKPSTSGQFLFLLGLTLLFAACQFGSSTDQSASVESTSLPRLATTSPLPTAAVNLSSIDSYLITLRQEESNSQAEDAPRSGGELRYTWKRANNQYGYNAHSITTIHVTLPPETADTGAVTEGVMDEQYLVDGIAFFYCGTCPDTAQQGGWGASQRGTEPEDGPRAIGLEKTDTIQSLYGSSIKTLVAQSALVGTESINGINTNHYQLTDVQTLREMMMNPELSADLQTAQVDIWLTIPEHLLIQYTFQAVGSQTASGGEPRIVKEEYSVTEFNRQNDITVPAEILTALAPQIESLKSK